MMTEVGRTSARIKEGAEGAQPGGQIMDPSHRCRIHKESSRLLRLWAPATFFSSPFSTSVVVKGLGGGRRYFVHFQFHLTGPQLCVESTPLYVYLAFLYKVLKCCRTHLDERCHPIINSYYSFYCLVRVLMLAFTHPYVSV